MLNVRDVFWIASVEDRKIYNFDDDDLDVIATLVFSGQLPGLGSEMSDECEVERHSRKKNKSHDFKAISERFDRMYFAGQSMYSEEYFERRFRMPRSVFKWYKGEY